MLLPQHINRKGSWIWWDRRTSGRRQRGMSLGGVAREAWVNAELPSDVGEFYGICEAAIGHHLSQSDSPRFGKEQPGNVGRCIKVHQTAVEQALGRRRELRLALLRTPSPTPQLKAFRYGRQCAEERVRAPGGWYSRSRDVSAALVRLWEVIMSDSIAHPGQSNRPHIIIATPHRLTEAECGSGGHRMGFDFINQGPTFMGIARSGSAGIIGHAGPIRRRLL